MKPLSAASTPIFRPLHLDPSPGILEPRGDHAANWLMLVLPRDGWGAILPAMWRRVDRPGRAVDVTSIVMIQLPQLCRAGSSHLPRRKLNPVLPMNFEDTTWEGTLPQRRENGSYNLVGK